MYADFVLVHMKLQFKDKTKETVIIKRGHSHNLINKKNKQH